MAAQTYSLPGTAPAQVASHGPSPAQLAAWRAQLDSGFAQVNDVFEDCLREAQALLSPEGLSDYLDAARFLGKMGRGVEPLLVFLQAWPPVARTAGEETLPVLMGAIRAIWKSPNGKAITPLLQSVPAIARRLLTPEQLQHYLSLSLSLMERTSGSIHGIHKTYASPSLEDFFQHSPQLLDLLSIDGLRRWVDYGVRNYSHHPERQRDYFTLQSADSRAVLQRERQGTLLVDHLRQFDLYLLGLWPQTNAAHKTPASALTDTDTAANHLVPYATALDALRQPVPYFDALGIRLPDVLLARAGVSGPDRYRATLAHMAAHRRWSSAIFADNYSPFQRMAIEFFEDARIDTLAMREYPGLRRLFMALHPQPAEGACNPATHSCLRHRLAMMSRALLDPAHGYQDAKLNEFAARFSALLEQGESSTPKVAGLALSYVAQTRLQSDQLASTYFTETEVDYRDDNRHLWRFHELSDDEEQFDDHRPQAAAPDLLALPPRHYPEWDYNSQSYRPDWVSLYERLHPSGRAADIDTLLAKHGALTKRLKRLLDLLKPQSRVRLRYQEEGSELDLDVAVRSLIDLKCGSQPDSRINLSHRTDGRNIAVLVLLDLSNSLNDTVPGTTQTILQLSQEAVSLLAWSVEQLGDPLAIAGFHSNTRHDTRYLHIKGFGEHWGDEVKSRLAAMEAAYSTRMGAALRHAAHYLGAQKADKKLLLILTDGQPSDVDSPDERLLIEDARQSVKELHSQGIFPYCINLDAGADAYVSDIFGQQYTVIDQIERLPERLPELFMALTR